uniref:Uncharacterized protein n=1 Tax=Cryptococcus bacillisporus CA1280 TaxID=1296109 RepID=A0A0D0UDU8_CRYGA|nr:hypothetical protein I312_03964 [Cryptococcus bacillisporus CA1280]
MPTRATRSTQEAPPTSPLAPAAEPPMNKRKRPSHDPPKRPFPDQKRPRVISKPTGINEEHKEADPSSPLGMSPPPRSSEPNVLSLEVRDALMDIISQMALGLPEPLEKALTLWLPPDFVEEEKNTLQYILRQPSLTWEELVKHRGAPLLGESVIRRASLKMNRWKELRRRKAGGGFGSIARGGESSKARDFRLPIVGIPNVGSSSFTPTFGPAYDSSGTTAGQGYYFTVEAMHERARHREWTQRALVMDQKLEEEDTGECIEESIQDRAPHHTVDAALVENGQLIAELQTWQEIRLRKGIESATQREQILARQLLSSLSQLTQVVSPAQLLPALRTKPGWSHILGRHILSTSSPSIRGTLDPRRPHALHDNTTIQLRSTLARNGVSNISNGSLPHNTPALVKTSTMPPPPSPQFSAPPPHILPISSPHNMSPVVTYSVSGRTHSPYLNPATPQPQPHSYSSFSPVPTAMPASSLVHIRPVQTMPPTGAYLRSGPGPSSLRQSLHQTPMGSQGPGVYGSPAGPGNNEYMWRL